jgi:hypothetical protein
MAMFWDRGAKISALIVLCLMSVSHSARAQAPAGCDRLPDAQQLDTSVPINVGQLKDNLIRYRCLEYDREVASVLAKARAWVEQRAPQVDKPAIVLDIDETSLSNWVQILHNDFAYISSGACDLKSTSACGQHEWELSASAVAIKPTLELFSAAKQLKGKDGSPVAVFFVTGRGENPFERIATEWNLHRVGYDKWEKLILRPDHPSDELVSVYKTKERKNIADHFTIVANIGDQISDLVGEAADRCFKVPNPFYFIPGEPVPATGLKCLAP